MHVLPRKEKIVFIYVFIMYLCPYIHFLATSGRPRPHLPSHHAPPRDTLQDC